MAGDFERANTADIEAAAGELESLNNKLKEQITESQRLINSLKGGWSGEAAEATFSAFNEFVKQYQENDHELIESYVNYLRGGVAPSWTQTETSNTELGSSFR